MVLPPASDLAQSQPAQPLRLATIVRPGPALPCSVRPQPPPDDDFISNSLPSVAASKANRQAVFTRPVASYVRVVPRVAATPAAPLAPSADTSSPSNSLEPMSTTNVSTPAPVNARAAFTPQVVNYLRTWLRDRMLTTGEGVPYVSEQERVDIAENTGLSARQVAQWFQNRRKDYTAAVRGHVDFLSTLALKE